MFIQNGFFPALQHCGFICWARKELHQKQTDAVAGRFWKIKNSTVEVSFLHMRRSRDIFRRGIMKGLLCSAAAAHFHACRPGSVDVRRKWTTPPPFPGQLPLLGLIKMHCSGSTRTSTCCLSALFLSGGGGGERGYFPFTARGRSPQHIAEGGEESGQCEAACVKCLLCSPSYQAATMRTCLCCSVDELRLEDEWRCRRCCYDCWLDTLFGVCGEIAHLEK